MECLEKYLYKRVKIETVDDLQYTGKVDMYWAADDDDNEEEGVGICLDEKTDYGIGVYKSEIKSIVEI